jgi:hypothetical protein
VGGYSPKSLPVSLGLSRDLLYSMYCIHNSISGNRVTARWNIFRIRLGPA